jgi:perosamine synthetase
MIPIAKPFIGKKELKEIEKVFETGWLGMGSWVKEFEEELKKYFGVKNAVAVNSGTSALHLSLECLGIGKGDEVVVPSLTFAASIQAIVACGAKPVFCDVYPDTLNLDVEDMEKKITSYTKAIMPVHYSGLPCRMDKILKIAKKNKIAVVEDAAHAFGSVYKGRKIGTFGDITCFSFDPIKIITCGEGGVIVTNNNKIARLAVKKRILGINKDTWSRYKHKRSWFYDVETLGFRYHMSNINAAIGLVQLKKLSLFLKRRKEIVKKYDRLLKGIDEIELIKHDYKNSASFNYIIKVKSKREKLMSHLKKNGIVSGIHYIPNHMQTFFKPYFTKLPVTEKVWNQILTLPLYYGLKDKEIIKITKIIKSFLKS